MYRLQVKVGMVGEVTQAADDFLLGLTGGIVKDTPFDGVVFLD